MSDFAQVLVYELNRYGAFAYPGSNALDRAMAHVANGEDAWNIGFEHAGLASEGPAFRPFPLGKQIPSGENEPALVTLDDRIQPTRARLGADKDEQRGGWFASCVAGGVASDGNRFEMILAVHFENARPRLDMDVVCLLDLINEVLRHRGGQRWSPHEHDYAAR